MSNTSPRSLSPAASLSAGDKPIQLAPGLDGFLATADTPDYPHQVRLAEYLQGHSSLRGLRKELTKPELVGLVRATRRHMEDRCKMPVSVRVLDANGHVTYVTVRGSRAASED